MKHDAYVVVMRPGEAGAALCAAIEKAGMAAYHFPVIDFDPVVPVDADLSREDWLIFNSPQAVKFALAANLLVLPASVQIAAVGSTTKATLERAGIQVSLVPDQEYSSEALLAMPALQSIKDKRITIMRGEGGRDLLEKVLLQRGAIVSSCVTYRRKVATIDAAPCQALLAQHKIGALVAGSYETVLNGKQLFGEQAWPLLQKVPLLVMSERIKALAASAGFQTIWVAETASNQAFLDLILKNKESITMSEQQETITKPASNKGGLVLGLITLLLVGGALGYSFYELSKVNVQLAQMVTDLKQQVAASQAEMTSVKSVVADMSVSSALSKSKEDSANVDLEKWHVSEAEYLTQLADHYVQVIRDPRTAIVLLQHANEILDKSPGDSLQPLRQAVQADLARMQANPVVNIEELYATLVAINKQFDRLPFPATPLQPSGVTPAPINSNPSKWQVGWYKAVEALNKIIVVRKMEGNDRPMVLPEEKTYLVSSLHWQMQAAMMAVLQRNPAIYQSSLQQMITWVEKYYVPDANETKEVLQQLRAVKEVNLEIPTVNFSATLQLFDQYLAANKQ